MLDWTVVQRREEMTVIPQGISLTETQMANYLRVRVLDRYLTIRIPKTAENEFTFEEEK